MKKLFTLCALAAVISFNAAGQSVFTPGYVITVKGDTIKGDIKHNPKKEFDLFTKVTVKIAENQNKTLKADKVKMFSFAGNTFISTMVDGEPAFLRILSTGAITLYEWQYEWINTKNETEYKTEYYMQKQGEAEPTRIKAGRFRKQVAEMISDNEDLVKELEEKKIEYNNLAEVIENYNKWAKQKS
jgi:hypothetical protein